MKSASFAASIGCSHDFGCHVHMTVGDMAIFVRHSIDLLLPFVGDVSDPLWQCWVAHVKYVRLLLQYRLTYDE